MITTRLNHPTAPFNDGPFRFNEMIKFFLIVWYKSHFGEMWCATKEGLITWRRVRRPGVIQQNVTSLGHSRHHQKVSGSFEGFMWPSPRNMHNSQRTTIKKKSVWELCIFLGVSRCFPRSKHHLEGCAHVSWSCVVRKFVIRSLPRIVLVYFTSRQLWTNGHPVTRMNGYYEPVFTHKKRSEIDGFPFQDGPTVLSHDQCYHDRRLH